MLGRLYLTAFPLISRLFVSKMNWSVTSQLSLGMPMQRFTSVKMIGVLVLCATSELICCIWPKYCFYFLFPRVLFYYSTFYCRAYGSGKEDNPQCDVPGFENFRMKLLRHVSFVDCPVRIQSCLFCYALENSICYS